MSSLPIAVFESFDPSNSGWSAAFGKPIAVYQAYRLNEVLPVLEQAQRAASMGHWVALMLSYEAAPAFEPAMQAHPPGKFPLAWAGVFEPPHSGVASVVPSDFSGAEWQPQLSFHNYAEAVAGIRSAIVRGDCYQVNYTFPLQSRFEGDLWGWYRALGTAQGAGYCAWLDLGRFVVISLSPELFFELKADRLRTRPMKGTAPRGRWKAEDDAQHEWLRNSAKNRAENLMIVDLLRNDLGRVSLPGSVQVTSLFEIERYETLFQMTSTIQSIAKPGLRLSDLLFALFPCGSVTGAPKISAMRIIRELEPFQRNVYTGAIGLVRPGGDCTFNVSIRTVVFDKETRQATFGVGGGITYDSTAENEYAECLSKARFLERLRPSFDLLETLLLEEGSYFLLDRHMQRMQESAAYFGFAWSEAAARLALEDVRANHPKDCWRVRLLATRSGELRTEAISLPVAAPGKVWRVSLASKPLDSQSPFLYHKTTHRRFYEEPLQARPDCDDLIFFNEHGEVTESGIANLVIVKHGEKLTPARASGLLAGTFREELLSAGAIREQVLTRNDVIDADQIYLINSVRKWMAAILV